MRSYVENNDTFVEKKKRKRMAVKIDGMCISGAGASGGKKAEGARIIVPVASFNPNRHTNLFFAGQSRQKYRIGPLRVNSVLVLT